MFFALSNNLFNIFLSNSGLNLFFIYLNYNYLGLFYFLISSFDCLTNLVIKFLFIYNI